MDSSRDEASPPANNVVTVADPPEDNDEPMGDLIASIAPVVASAARAIAHLSDKAATVDEAELPESASPVDHIRQAPHLVFGVDELWQMQAKILHKMLVENRRRALFIDRTGGGKSHVMRLLATCMKGVHLYFCPLLALMAGIVLKFQAGDQTWTGNATFRGQFWGGLYI